MQGPSGVELIGKQERHIVLGVFALQFGVLRSQQTGFFMLAHQ